MPLHTELARLRAAEAAAKERADDLRERLRDEATFGPALLKPWTSGAVRQPSTDQLRQWTDNLLATMRERDLAFENRFGHLTLCDPNLRDEHADAQERLAAARRKREAFEQANADGLRAERSRQKARALREAIEGDDFDAIQRQLAPAGR